MAAWVNISVTLPQLALLRGEGYECISIPMVGNSPTGTAAPIFHSRDTFLGTVRHLHFSRGGEIPAGAATQISHNEIQFPTGTATQISHENFPLEQWSQFPTMREFPTGTATQISHNEIQFPTGTAIQISHDDNFPLEQWPKFPVHDERNSHWDNDLNFPWWEPFPLW